MTDDEVRDRAALARSVGLRDPFGRWTIHPDATHLLCLVCDHAWVARPAITYGDAITCPRCGIGHSDADAPHVVEGQP